MSESNNNIPMRITQLEEAETFDYESYLAEAKAGSGTKKVKGSTLLAELIDVRQGADGVTYSTAGNAVRGQFDKVNPLLGVAVSAVDCDTYFNNGNYRVSTLSGTLPSNFSSTNVMLENRNYNGWVIQKIYHLQAPNDVYIRYIQISNPTYTWYKLVDCNVALSSGTNIDNVTITGKYTVNSPMGTLPSGWSTTSAYYLEVNGFGKKNNNTPRYAFQIIRQWSNPSIMQYRMIDTERGTVGAWVNEENRLINNLIGTYTQELNCNTFFDSGNYRVSTLNGTLPTDFSSSNVILENRNYNGWVIQKIYHLLNPNEVYIRYIQLSNPSYTWYRLIDDNIALSSGTDIDDIITTGKYTVNSPMGTLPSGWVSSGVAYFLKVEGYGKISDSNKNPRYIMQTLRSFASLGIIATRVIDAYNNTVGDWDISQSGSGLDGNTIVCFGDSITGNLIPPNDYPSMLSDLTGATVYNVGFGGCCMADVTFRKPFTMCNLIKAVYEDDYTDQDESGITIDYQAETASGFVDSGIDYVPTHMSTLKNIDWDNVNYIIIAYGTNDFTNSVALDNPNDKYDVTTYAGAFRYSIEKIWAINPNIKVIPITPLWRWYTGEPYKDSDTYSINGHYLYEFAETLKNVSEEYHLPCLDIYYNSGFNKYNRLNYFYDNDGTHPKHNGMESFAKKIANYIMYSIAR